MKHPVIIGAVGGSGTRVIARIVKHAGYFMGKNLNISEDAMDFVEFYDRWINCFIHMKDDPLTEIDIGRMIMEFTDCIVRHRALIPNEHMDWGWKEPRSIYLIKFFHKYFPRMKFIHVIRDGRDIAFSRNQNQLKKHGNAVLESNYVFFPLPIQMAMLWNKINLMVSDYGETNMGDHYLRIRYEDLCQDPETIVNMIYNFIDPNKRFDIHDALSEVIPPESIGRWRACDDSKLMLHIQTYAREALVRFCYLQEDKYTESQLIKKNK